MSCSRWECVPERSERQSPDHWRPVNTLSCGSVGCWFHEPVCCPLAIVVGDKNKQSCWFIPCFPLIAGCAHAERQDDGTMMVANHCGICAWPGKGCYRNVAQVLPAGPLPAEKPEQAGMIAAAALAPAPAQVLESIPQPKSLEDWVKLAEESMATAKCAAAAVEKACKMWAGTVAEATEKKTFPRDGLEAWFRAEDYDPISKAWNDRKQAGNVCNLAGAELTILDEAGNGAKGIVRAVRGEPSTMLDFGPIIKPAFTCATVSRYMPGTHGRIFQGNRSNWLHGHHGNHAGVAHYDGWKTKTDLNTGCQNWIIFIGQNGGENIKRCNEADVKTADGGSGDQSLMVNQGACAGEKSHFALLEVLTWSRHLSRAEIVNVEQYFRQRLDAGFSQEKLQILTELSNCAAAARLSCHAARSAETCLLDESSQSSAPAAETLAQVMKTVGAVQECFAICRTVAVEALEREGEDDVELSVTSSLKQAYTKQLHKLLAAGKLEEAARLESIPLKILVKAPLEAETVRKLVMPDELPHELDLLQQLQGDAQCVPCPLCAGAGSAGKDAITREDSLKRSLSSPGLTGALAVVAAARFKSLVDCETLWLFETNAGGWDAYKPTMAKVLEKAFHEGPGALVQVKGPRFEYLVDIGAMTQTNPETGTVRRVLRAAPGEDGCLELPALAEKVTAKRRSCRYGEQCTRKNPKHFEQFAHPGDEDYKECLDNTGDNTEVDNNVVEKPRVAAWLFCDPAASDDWTMFDEVIAAHLEKLHLSKSLASIEVIIRDPGKDGTKGEGDLRVNLEKMKAAAVATGKIYTLKRVFDDEDEEEVGDNSIPESSPQETQEEVLEEKLPCWLCRGSGRVSELLSPEDVSAATGLRESGDRKPYTCLVCYGDGQFAISAQCGKHFFCADCIQGSLDAILSSGQFPAVCPMCRAEAMGDVESMQGEITDQDLSFLQQREVITNEFLFRFMRQAKQSTAKYFACPAKKCGRYCLEKDVSYPYEPGSMFSLGCWQGDKFFGLEKQLPRLGACVCGAYICVLCNQAEENAATHVCPDEKGRPEAADGMEALLKANIAKKCPNCPALIIKNEGCNFMTCAACKDPRGFCWVTGKPRHGPCPPCCGGGHNCH